MKNTPMECGVSGGREYVQEFHCLFLSVLLWKIKLSRDECFAYNYPV
jgi:hypothetical protein